jgi:hypothetical protein
MRVSPLELLVMALKGEDPMGVGINADEKRIALDELKRRTGQDFGTDWRKWDQWLKHNMGKEYTLGR